MGLSNAQRQQRWRDRRKAAGLGPPPWKQAPTAEHHPGPAGPDDLRAALVDYFGADPDHWNFDGGDEPPAEGQADRHAAKVLGELEKALFALADEWNLDTPVPENPAAEAARLRVMALLSAIMPIPTRDEWARRAEAEREAEVAKKKAAAAARQKERRAIKKGGRPSEDTRHEQFRLEPRATPEDAPAVQAGPVIRPGTS